MTGEVTEKKFAYILYKGLPISIGLLSLLVCIATMGNMLNRAQNASVFSFVISLLFILVVLSIIYITVVGLTRQRFRISKEGITPFYRPVHTILDKNPYIIQWDSVGHVVREWYYFQIAAFGVEQRYAPKHAEVVREFEEPLFRMWTDYLLVTSGDGYILYEASPTIMDKNYDKTALPDILSKHAPFTKYVELHSEPKRYDKGIFKGALKRDDFGKWLTENSIKIKKTEIGWIEIPSGWGT